MCLRAYVECEWCVIVQMTVDSITVAYCLIRSIIGKNKLCMVTKLVEIQLSQWGGLGVGCGWYPRDRYVYTYLYIRQYCS